MCGIIGMTTDNPKSSHRDLLEGLFNESKIRGIHAFGFSHWDGESVVTKRFSRLDQCLSALPSMTTRLVGHCRYSTSGDHAIIDNNQPIQMGCAALAFNGVISMATKAEYERQYGKNYATDNDGEIFLDKFSRNDEWERFIAEGQFSFAGLILFRDVLIALRNARRPLYRCSEAGAAFFASTFDIFRRAGFRGVPESLPPGIAHHAS